MKLTELGKHTFLEYHNNIINYRKNNNIHETEESFNLFLKEQFRYQCLIGFISIQQIIDNEVKIDEQFLNDSDIREKVIEKLNSGNIPEHELFIKYKTKNDDWE